MVIKFCRNKLESSACLLLTIFILSLMFSVPTTVYVCSNFIGSGNIQDFQVLMFCTVPIIDDIKKRVKSGFTGVLKILELYLFCFCVQMKLPVKIFKMVEYSCFLPLYQA